MVQLTILLIGIGFDAWVDYRLINKGRNPHTWIQYTIREAFFLLIALTTPNILETWAVFHLVYWWTFDTLLNVLRKKPLEYLSDRGIDQYQRPLLFWWWFKLFFAIMGALYFINPGLYSYP